VRQEFRRGAALACDIIRRSAHMMTASDLVDRLAQHKTIGAAPRKELEWMASHGLLRQLREGDVLTAKGAHPEGMFVVLSGHLAMFVDRGAGPYKIMEWRAGDVAGLLPYSRLVSPPGDNAAQEPSEVLALPRQDLPDMTRECHEITSILVGSMIDRARAFHANDLRDAKIVAEKATQAKSEFLARMSHEIRTPLNAVIGMADVLASSRLTSHQRKCVEISQRNGIALLNLINDILDLTKVESGKVELEAIGFNLREVLAGAAEVVEAKASAKGLWLRQTIDPAIPVYLIGDPNRLRQVLINLLGNSMKFTESGGIEIRVEADPENGAAGRLRFAVSDTGIGIEPDKVNAVFESFTQVDASTTRKYGGTGLGLTISKQLVELMGGRLWLESKVGVGSTFFFTAQLTVQESQAERREERPQTPLEQLERRIAGMRILLVDDSDDNRFLVASYLKRIECSIDAAENGADAVGLFKANRYDVVLMDGEMPVMDGYTATREIRQFETGNQPPEKTMPGTPILAFTAHAFSDKAARAFEAGYTDLLTKPLRRVTLLEALARHGKQRAAALKSESMPGPAAAMAAGHGGDAGGIRVVAEPDMRDVAPGYLEKRRAELLSCYDALAEGNLASIQAVAHKMKGTGAGYGFPFLTEIGEKIEMAAREGQADELKARIAELASYLERLDINPGR
jgi:signal transduction histidine kinase/CheY-like chemotaxis protein/HPt (histidine-containing phosphotransfer) domain-containing protein